MVPSDAGNDTDPSDDAVPSIRDESESPRPAKLSAIAMTEATSTRPAMQCSLPPHRETLDFASIEEFEIHYAKDHSNRCSSCGKNFPTAHFLALHIDEHHNTFREALQAKGEKTYACFVEDCDRRCSTPQKRRLHLIDKHLFPKVYNFRIVDTGIDRSTSMLHETRRRRVSTADQAQSSSHRRRQSRPEPGFDHANPVPVPPEQENRGGSMQPREQDQEQNLKSSRTVSDSAINDLEISLSALRFVPPSVASKQRRDQHRE